MNIADLTTGEFIAVCVILGVLLLGLVSFVATPFVTAANDQKDVNGWRS